MSTQTLTVQQLAVLPRVNLLPPEIAQRRKARTIQVGMGAAVLGSAVVVGVAFLMAQQSAGNAEEELAAAQAQQTVLQTELARYAGDQQLRSQQAAQEAMLEQAMAPEIRWSHFMADLSLRIPDNVWVTNLKMSQTVDAATDTTATAPTATTSVLPTGIGQVTVEGIAMTHDDVAAWLDSLAKQKGYANPFFTSSEADVIGDVQITKFTSDADVTEEARSGRYTQSAGS